MSRLADFFKGADTRLGVFYPDHTLIAIFGDVRLAQNAKGKLCGAGFSDEEALVASGADLIDLVHEESARHGVFGYLIKQVSQFLHTEAVYTDQDLVYAKRGAARARNSLPGRTYQENGLVSNRTFGPTGCPSLQLQRHRTSGREDLELVWALKTHFGPSRAGVPPSNDQYL